ncbi:MAG: carbohydrate-binding domain-containing protein [Bacteroidetes bacterium]|nr:carbohydrate-binding domain-containing protein [Bacteroidota bacterium]
MSKIKVLLTTLLLAQFIFSCKKDSDITPDDSSDTQDEVNALENMELASDYSWNAADEKVITLNGTSGTVNGTGASISNGILKISSAGTYKISGTLTNGQIVVSTDDKNLVRVILNGVNVTSAKSSPLFLDNAEKVIVVLAEGTNNVLTDASTYSDVSEGQNAAFYSQTYTAIMGTGNLTVTGKFADGIASKDGLVIKNGNITVNAVDDGIRGKDFLVIRGGNFNVNAGGDGLKSDNETDTEFGYIGIEDGSFKITSGGDGISAQTNVNITGGNFNITSGGGSSKTVAATLSAKGIKGLTSVALNGSFTINSADDGIHSNTKVSFFDGVYEVSSADDGIHADNEVVIKKGTINITKAYEGVEAKFITIDDGNMSIVSSNDCLNATAGNRTEQNDGAILTINGGYIVLNGSAGDPLDSNGSMVQTGGTVIAHGPNSSPEVPIDYNGTFNISGGILLASAPGTQMFQAPSTSSKQNSLKLTFKSQNAAETLFHIKDDKGNSLVTFKPARKYIGIVFSAAELVKGTTYTISTGGTSTGTLNGGLYSGGVYSGGAEKGTFTITSTVTSVSI